MFNSIFDAESYLKNKLQHFYDQGQVLNDRIIAIGRLLKIAREKNDQQALGQLTLLKSQAQELYMEHLQMRERFAPFGEYFNVRMSLGFLPVVLAGTAISAAAALYLFFQKLETQKKALDLVAKGLMTPAEADAIVNPSFLGSLANVGGVAFIPMLGLGAVALFLFLRK